MAYVYDKNNVFARILRGEIPNQTVLETEHTLAFRDITPKAPIHVLVVPKGPYVTMDHFYAEATDAEILDFSHAVAKVCAMVGALPGADGRGGYRVISNAGTDSGQEVPHFHVHILSGRPLGPLLAEE